MALDTIRLRIFSDFADSTGLKNAFRSWNYGRTDYKNLFVVDDDSYTHVAIYNFGRPDIKHIPKKNVIGFMHEPFDLLNIHSYMDYVRDNIGTYIVHDKSRYPDWECFKEGMCYLAPQIPIEQASHYKDVMDKPFTMSIIASAKQAPLQGWGLRHEIIRRILKTNMNIHIYGRGCGMYSDQRVKGEINEKEKAFLPYKYSIAIENSAYRYWITEKFYDPILCSCIPLYWGASEVSKIFGNDSHIQLPTNPDQIMSVIADVYYNPQKYNKNIIPAKNMLLNEKNFAHYLWEHFNGIK
jgi:hypothetical protein